MLKTVAKTFGRRGSQLKVLDDVSLDLAWGEFLAVVGPSGCGKTTLLRLLAGIEKPTAGEVLHDGATYKRTPPWLGLVFQDYSRSLFPWLTVAKNVTFAPREKQRILRARVGEALESVGLAGFEGYYPWQLSGGMQQRVALARAIVRRPKVLLLDEPFASIDAQTRLELQDLILSLSREHNITCLLVTHDVDEAVYMADRVTVLSNRPTSVIRNVGVPISKPRDQIVSRGLPEFANLRGDILEEMRHQVKRPQALE